MNSDIINLLNLKFNKLKPDLGLKQVALFGLIYSVWTQGIFIKAFNLDNPHAEGFYISGIRNTCNIAYVATTIGVLYENKISQSNCIILWELMKIVDLIFNLASFSNFIAFSRYIEEYIIQIICILIFMLLGMYLMYLMKNIYDQTFPTEAEKRKNETNIEGS